MAYRLPTFNLSVQIWTGGHVPSLDPPDIIAVPAQLYVFSKGIFGAFPNGTFQSVPSILFRFPLGVYLPAAGDIIDSINPAADYYLVGWHQRLHPGFPNEYLAAYVNQCDAAGVTPRP